MAKKATILILDRERILVDLLIRTLSSPELAVIGATSADEAVRLMDLHGPELVVADPSVQNGFALLSSIRNSNFGPKIIAVVSDQESKSQTHALGIEKTVDRAGGLDGLVGAIRGSIDAALPMLHDAGKVGILIADDEEGLRDVLTEFLTGRGYAVTTAGNGREAIDRIAGTAGIQIVLLDVSMPEMGGMEVLALIMSREPHPNVIMMTAVADREIARQAMKIGAFDYILKPFDFAAIEASIAACMSHSEYQKQPWWKRLTRR